GGGRAAPLEPPRHLPPGTGRARVPDTARPMAGKMNTLLHWETRTFRPRYSTSANGEPVAINARPSVQRNRSAGTASDFEVGLDSGKIIGRSHLRAISRTMGSVNAPGRVESPTRMVPAIL